MIAFPAEAIDEFGYALGLVQPGALPPSAKPWKGEGPDVYEIVERYLGDALRAADTVRFQKAVYVLHCFQKKSPDRIRTAKTEVD